MERKHIFFTSILILNYLAIAVIIYIVITDLVRTENATRNGEELLSYAAILAMITAVIKFFLLTGYSFVGGDEKTYNRMILILSGISIVALPILIGVGYSRLRDSSDWQYNSSGESLILISLGLSFVPIVITALKFLWDLIQQKSEDTDTSVEDEDDDTLVKVKPSRVPKTVRTKRKVVPESDSIEDSQIPTGTATSTAQSVPPSASVSQPSSITPSIPRALPISEIPQARLISSSVSPSNRQVLPTSGVQQVSLSQPSQPDESSPIQSTIPVPFEQLTQGQQLYLANLNTLYKPKTSTQRKLRDILKDKLSEEVQLLTEKRVAFPLNISRLEWIYHQSIETETKIMTMLYWKLQDQILIPQQIGKRIIVSGVEYDRNNEDTHFEILIKKPEYGNTLFLFNDNIEDYLDFHLYAKGTPTSAARGGNAIIRDWQLSLYNKPMAASFPTGFYAESQRRGERIGVAFESGNFVKDIIDYSFEYIARLLLTGAYDRVVYSKSPNEEGIGLGYNNFKINTSSELAVKRYIENKIDQLGNFTVRDNDDGSAQRIAEIESKT